jgi:hypothetical protein
MPDLLAQRAAMNKLRFLVGRWAGQARVRRGRDVWVHLLQTEEAQFKLDGLILVIEGIGKSEESGEPLLQALGVISYNDENATYHLRAFNDGRFLESEIKLLEAADGLTWGFSAGTMESYSTLRITSEGEWTELTELKIGEQPAFPIMHLAVRRQ